MKMVSWTVWTGVLLFLCSTPIVALGAVPLIDESTLEGTGLSRHWDASLPLAPGDKVAAVHLVDDSIYVSTSSSTLYALDAETGLLRWAARVDWSGHRLSRPSHVLTPKGDGPVAVAAGGDLITLDRTTGEIYGRLSPGFAMSSAPVGIGRGLFVGGSDSRFYSLIPPATPDGEPLVVWQVTCDLPVAATPVVYDGNRLLFASSGGTVVSCRARNKVLDWSVRLNGPVLADPVIDAGGAYVACKDQSLYKINVDRGAVTWRLRLPSPLEVGPAVVAHTVYQPCPRVGVVAVDSSTGQERWRLGGVRHLAAHQKDRDVLLSSDGTRLVLVDHEGGAEVGAIALGAGYLAVVNSATDAVIVAAMDGRCVCLRPDEVPYLRRQQVLAARARMERRAAEKEISQKDSDRAKKNADTERNDPLRSKRDKRP